MSLSLRIGSRSFFNSAVASSALQISKQFSKTSLVGQRSFSRLNSSFRDKQYFNISERRAVHTGSLKYVAHEDFQEFNRRVAMLDLVAVKGMLPLPPGMINEPNNLGESPLSYLFRFFVMGYERREAFDEIALTLLNHGANPNLIGSLGNTVLHRVVQYVPLHDEAGEFHRSTLKMLLGKGADPNCIDAKGNTAFHDIARVKLSSRHLTYCCEVLRRLIEAGADLSLKNNEGKTALQVAVTQEIAEILAEQDSKKLIWDHDNITA